jgi:hypothetical protein
MPDVVLIATYTKRLDAEVAKSALEGSGIQAYIEGDDAGGMYPSMTEGIRLSVQKKDKEKALILLKGI